MPVKIYSCSFSEKLTSILSHWHQEIEVTLICSGKTSYQVGGIEFLAHEGDILIISPCVLHGARKLPRVACKTESIVCDLHMFCSAATEGAIYQLFLPIIAQKRRFKTLIRPGDPAYAQIFSCVSSAISCYNNRIRCSGPVKTTILGPAKTTNFSPTKTTNPRKKRSQPSLGM